jgi:hypothetical protein
MLMKSILAVVKSLQSIKMWKFGRKLDIMKSPEKKSIDATEIERIRAHVVVTEKKRMDTIAIAKKLVKEGEAEIDIAIEEKKRIAIVIPIDIDTRKATLNQTITRNKDLLIDMDLDLIAMRTRIVTVIANDNDNESVVTITVVVVITENMIRNEEQAANYICNSCLMFTLFDIFKVQILPKPSV